MYIPPNKFGKRQKLSFPPWNKYIPFTQNNMFFVDIIRIFNGFKDHRSVLNVLTIELFGSICFYTFFIIEIFLTLLFYHIKILGPISTIPSTVTSILSQAPEQIRNVHSNINTCRSAIRRNA